MKNTISFNIVGVTEETLQILSKTDNYTDNLALYMVYVEIGTWQKTTQVKATSEFMMNRTGWGKKRFHDAKRELIRLELIRDVRVIDEKSKKVTGYYIKIGHYWSNFEETNETQKRGGVETEGVVFDSQSALNLNKSALDLNKSAKKTNKVKSDEADILEIYNYYIEKCNKNGLMYKLTPKRKDLIKRRLKEVDNDVSFIKKAILNASLDSFFNGDNNRGWKGDLDYLMRSYEKLEYYHNKSINEKQKQSVAFSKNGIKF